MGCVGGVGGFFQGNIIILLIKTAPSLKAKRLRALLQLIFDLLPSRSKGIEKGKMMEKSGIEQ